MHKSLAIVFGLIAWFAVIMQLVLMLQNRVADVPETIVRFFSFFTILTNIIAALYFTGQSLNFMFTYKPGVLTAVTGYIFIVGIVYQFLLRHLWHPTGMQLVVDELLHSVNPLLVIVFWILYEKKREVRYSQIKGWIGYPLGYFLFIMIRGNFSGFYPYPFVDVIKIGLTKTLVNSILFTMFFVVIACLFVAIGRKMEKKKLLLT